MPRTFLVSILASFLVIAAPLTAQERAIAIRGGTVLPVSGPAIPNGTVVIRGGKIVAIGANVTVRHGVTIADAVIDHTRHTRGHGLDHGDRQSFPARGL